MVMRIFSGGSGTTGPRVPLLRSYSRFIFACPRIVPALARWLCALKLSECWCHEARRKLPAPSLGVHPERHVAFFRGLLIQQSDSTVIIEHDDRNTELDSVLPPVRPCLFGSPSNATFHTSSHVQCTPRFSARPPRLGRLSDWSGEYPYSIQARNLWQICGRIGGKTLLLHHHPSKSRWESTCISADNLAGLCRACAVRQSGVDSR